MSVPVYATILSTPLGARYGGQGSALVGTVYDASGNPITLYDSSGNSLATTVFQHTEIGANSGQYQVTIYLPTTQAGVAAYTWSGTPAIAALGTDVVAPVAATVAGLTFTGGSVNAYATNMPSSLVIQLLSTGANAVMTAGPKVQAIAIARGTDATLTFTFANTDGTAKDITGVTAELLVKANLSDADAAAIITLTTANGRITLPTPANGLMFAAIHAADTALTTGAADSTAWLDYGLKVWSLGGQQLAEAGGAFRVTPFAVQGLVSP